MKPRAIATTCLATFVLVMTGPAAHAVLLYWDLNGTTANTAAAVTGAWNGTNTFWNTASTGTGGAVRSATTNADDLFFSSGTNLTTGTVTASNNRVASSITFEDNVIITLAGPVTVGGTGTKSGIFAALTKTTATTVSGAVTLAAASTLQTGNGTFTQSGAVNLGSNTLAIDIAGTGRLTVSGVISGTGAVAISGSSTGDYVPGGLHTYSGGTTLNAGGFTAVSTSSVGPDGAPTTGCFGTGVLTLAGGQLRSGNGASFNIGNTVTISGDSTFYTTANEKSLSFSGPVTLSGGNRTLTSTVGTTVAGTSAIFNGNIGDAGATLGIIKAGLGNITLNGNNTYGGNTTIGAGMLSIGSKNALPGWDTNGRFSVASGATLAVQSGVIDTEVATMLGTSNFAADAVLGFDTVSGNRTYALNLSDTAQGSLGLSKVSANMLSLNGTNTYTGITNIRAGALSIGTTSSLPGWNTNGRFAVTSGAALAVQNAVSDAEITTILGGTNLAAGAFFGFDTSAGDRTYTDVLSDHSQGALNLQKYGANALTLSGANTYTGSTNVTEGTLTLTGNRTVTPGALNIGSIGRSGTLNIQGDLPLATGNNFIGSGAGGTGIVNQSSGNVSFGAATVLHFGSAGVSGNDNTATYNLSGGTLGGATTTGLVSLGVNSFSQNTFNQTGGDLYLPLGGLHVGRNNRNDVRDTSNTFSQSGGTALVGTLIVGGNNDTAINAAGVDGTLNLSGGTFSANNFSHFAAGRENHSSVNISGTAMVTLPAFPTTRGTGSTATLTFDGGTLSPAAASTAYMGGLTNAFIKAGGARLEVALNKDITVSQALLTDPVSMGGGLTKAGAGVLTLTGASNYTGATALTAGTLAISGTGTLAGTSGLSVNSGAKFLNLTSGTLTLGTTGTLSLANQSSIGGTFGSTIAAPGAASASGIVNLLPSGAFTSGNTYTLLAATGGLDGATYQVLNPTDFTFTTAVTATSVQITPTTATPLAAPYWVGGLAGSSRIWAASNGSTASNWASDSIGTPTPLVPGPSAALVFNDTSPAPGNLLDMTLGSDMSIGGMTVTSANNLILLKDGVSALTIGSSGIAVNPGAGSVTLNPDIVVGAAQSWVNNSSNPLVLGGAVGSTGTNTLTINGTGATTFANFIGGGGGLTVLAGNTTLATASPTVAQTWTNDSLTPLVGSSRVDLQACKLEYSIVSPK